MVKLVEVVPNFSEGKDRAKVDLIVEAARSAGNVTVLDLEMDPDHHRSVLSFVAPPEIALEAALRAAKKAAELIDLTGHKGEHPRMGATDVIPFIPVGGTTMEECVALAGRLAERIAGELLIPTYLYDRAARRPERKDLAVVRKGQFEGLREEVGRNPDRAPDFGPARLHPTAGATAVGAREQIINFNVNLRTKDMALAKDIARKVRASSGGFPNVRAKEIELKEKGVQVSTVLTDYRTTPLFTVYEAIAREAGYCGVEVESTEIVGLVPRPALLGFVLDALKLKGFDPKIQILEDRLLELAGGSAGESGADWTSAADAVIDAVALPTATPGGGAVSAMVGAAAAGLGRMVAGISVKHFEKKGDPARLAPLRDADRRLEGLVATLKSLMREDAAAFDAVMAGYKTPKDDPSRPGKIQAALVLACEVPFRTAEAVRSTISLLKELEGCALESVASDLKTGRVLARAAIHGALENVSINLGSIKDGAYVLSAQARMKEILKGMG